MRIRLLACGAVLALYATAASAAVIPLPGVTPQYGVARTPFANAPTVLVVDETGQPVGGA